MFGVDSEISRSFLFFQAQWQASHRKKEGVVLISLRNVSLDDKDHSIIAVLRENSRMAIRDIAKATKLRPSTVHDRLRRMKEQGIIEKFTLKLNNKAVGENFIVFMLIKTDKEIPASVFHDSQVKEVFGVTGEYDLLLKLKFEDIEQFNHFVIKFRKEHKPTATLTLVSTIEIKEEL